MNYDNFLLPVDDMNKARDYYENTLGLALKFDFSAKGMIAFCVGEEEPAIILKDVARFGEIKPSVWLEVESVESEYARLKAKGVAFLSEPIVIHTGLAVEFEDPFGNRFGITDYTKTTAGK
ncbi:MAG: glyoxalase/bleomycin resistance protein/dioxygenase [Bacillota bacterium]|jgi:predicted enzyme related to lactoylglutathione lyase|nr:glyoxalase/bleomycin resistance protein/dioxygenase [Bacillota bacterium]